jgi:hypothetical protein
LPENDFRQFEIGDMELAKDDDGAVVTLAADPCAKCSPRTLGFD